MPVQDRLHSLVPTADLTLLGTIGLLAAAAGWGALHALSPGHGKTLVGAYLAGTRGTPRHALFLGLTVTLTHTAGVVALGLAILLASRSFVPEKLYPWLSLISGATIVALGLTLLHSRLAPARGHHHHHDHDHDQTHDHAHAHANEIPHLHAHGGRTHSHLPAGADRTAVTWRSLLALGVAGGLLPCPSALLASLGAVAIGKAGMGVVVGLAFSVGLAATLTAVGLAVLYAGRFFSGRRLAGPWPARSRYAALGGAAAVTLTGVLVVGRALVETGIVR